MLQKSESVTLRAEISHIATKKVSFFRLVLRGNMRDLCSQGMNQSGPAKTNRFLCVQLTEIILLLFLWDMGLC